MSIMSSVDIVLTDYKLSDAQKNAVIELLTGGFNTAKPNTIGSLVKKGLVIDTDGVYTLEESFHGKIREAYSVPEFYTQEELDHIAMVDEINGEVLGTQDDYVLTGDESFSEIIGTNPQDLHESVDETYLDISPETFDADWVQWELEIMGFEAVTPWRNRKVWHGLTAQEIADDIKTARPVGRADRRAQKRLARQLLRVA